MIDLYEFKTLLVNIYIYIITITTIFLVCIKTEKEIIAKVKLNCGITIVICYLLFVIYIFF